LKQIFKVLSLTLLSILLLSGCAEEFYPMSYNSAYFSSNGEIFQLIVEPYENAMPGANSTDIIIPISFEMSNKLYGEEWVSKFKINKIEISGVADKFTDIKRLDHQGWLHNSEGYEDHNTLRVPETEIGYGFNFSIWIEDNHGKKFKTIFRSLGVGKVY
jgi:hypothetical protein